MKKNKWGRGKKQAFFVLVMFAALAMAFTPVALADEGGQSDGGFLSGVKSGLSNLTSGMFSELSPEDVGFKPRVKPHFSFTQGFISNARLGENQADAAWQARVAPGITLAIPSGKLYTEVDYTYGFSTTQGRKTSANVNTHNINALARYDLSADTIIGVGNNLQLSEVPGESGKPFTLETATAQVKHRIGSKLTASVTDTLQAFGDKSQDRQNDFVDNGVSLDLPYEVTSDLSVGPSFKWNVRNFTSELHGKDYWQIQPGVGAAYRLGPKTTVSGNFGWAYRKFDQKQGANDTESELVYGLGTNHKLGTKFVWSVNYQKSIVDTFDTNFVFNETPVATTLDNLDREFRVIKSHRIGSSGTYHLDEKNSVGVFADFQFLYADAKDNITHKTDNDEKAMEAGLSYSYRLSRYISFDVLYRFGRRFTAESNPRTRNDYSFHNVSGGVNIAV